MGLFRKSHSTGGDQKVAIDINEPVDPIFRRASGQSPLKGGDKAGGSVLPPPLDYHGRQIEELLLKVIRIETACLGEDETKPGEIDEFVELKKELYCIIMSTKQMVREKYRIQTAQGNTVEAIQKSSQINKNVETLNAKFIQLKEAFKKQTKKAGKTISPDELDIRFKELQIIKRQIEDCKKLVKQGTEVSEEEMVTLTDFLSQMEQTGVAPPQEFDSGAGGRWREPTAEEQAAINRWAARDKEFDAQIWDVGKVVDNLQDIAVKIGETAEEQGKMAVELSRQADEANQEVVEVNTKLKKLVGSGNGINFCCKLVLTLILVAMIGFIAQNAVTRIKQGMGLESRSARVSPSVGHAAYLASRQRAGGAGNGTVAGDGLPASSTEAAALIQTAMNGVVHDTNVPWAMFEKLIEIDRS